MALNNKLLTRDIRLKRGWIGPSHCALCKSTEESISHIFIVCPYATQVTRMVSSELQVKIVWNKSNLRECFNAWLSNSLAKQFEGLPCIIFHSLWWDKNSNVFKSVDIPPEVTYNIIPRLEK
jgi:hypothetical protein